MKPDNFTDIPKTWDNMSMYVIRSSIWKAVQACASKFSGHLLDVGCGRKPYRQYLLENKFIERYSGLDIESAIVYEEHVKPEYTWDGVTMPFADNSFDTLMATEVLEHCPDPHVTILEMKRVLKPGGLLFFTVPFLWNLHEVPHDEYRYTPFALERIFKECGMVDIEINAHGGWDMAMAQMIGMWVTATQFGKKRKRWGKLLNPVMKWLLKRDVKNHPIKFTDGMMINGLYGLAKKATN
ncbi:MAG: class I SAM-dependent methyltransferase [Bacteroidetes bacterium]|nr:class I SAM-dependent methyltransferase [Bacteroidota bacterium]